MVKASIRNIVLVHGAWVDGSGWKPVYDILTKDGYHVSVVQEPLSGLEDDVAATKQVLDMQAGPVVHSCIPFAIALTYDVTSLMVG